MERTEPRLMPQPPCPLVQPLPSREPKPTSSPAATRIAISRMTIQTTGSDDVIEQITKHLNRLIEVVKVVDLSETILPLYPSGWPGNENFAWKFVNYAPLLTGGVIMVGIAGGVPNPAKPDDHVRLGDVVVSDRNGVVQYDLGKEQMDKDTREINFIVRTPPRPPSAELLETARLMRAGELRGERAGALGGA